MSQIDKVVNNPQSLLSTNARTNLKKFVEKIDKKLDLYFEKKINNQFGVNESQKELYRQIWEHIKEHNLRPAKRLRASFVYYGYKLFNGVDDELILDAAMSVELVQTALLMHDDFMDLDDTRRGKPTTHEFFKNIHEINYKNGNSEHYGHSMAVDIGDIALLAGHQILLESEFEPSIKIKALNSLFTSIMETGIGQAYDITLESSGNAIEQDILDLHWAKTGIYTYKNPLQIGAILADATDNDLDLLSEYAKYGGVAFQIQDDILGVFGDSESTGKPDYSDIKQGKMTILYTKALENADELQTKTLSNLWGKPNITDTEVIQVRNIIKVTQSLEYSIDKSRQLAKQAVNVTNEMRDRNWNPESVDYLEGIAQYMVERNV